MQIEAPSTCTRPTCTRLGPPPFRGGGPQVRHRLARGGVSVCVAYVSRREPHDVRQACCATPSQRIGTPTASLSHQAMTSVAPRHVPWPHRARVLAAPVHGTGLRGTSCAVVRGRAVLCSRAVRYRARAGAASCSTGSCGTEVCSTGCASTGPALQESQRRLP